MNDDEVAIVEALKDANGRCNNGTLQDKLGWESTRYWNVRNALLERGIVSKVRGGPGGQTILNPVAQETAGPQAQPESSADVPQEHGNNRPYEDRYKNEEELYPPLLRQLEMEWAKSEAYDRFLISNTSRQGRKETRGSWTRPDICLLGVRKFKFIPGKVIDLVTFEIKHKMDITVKGVFEALSHRQVANQAYVMFAASVQEFEENKESDRIRDLSKAHGVGIIIAQDPEQQQTWVELVRARRWEPDPEDLNSFIQEVLPRDIHDQILMMVHS